MSPSTDTRESREFAHEIKFLVTPERAAQIREWARTHLSPDPHGNGAAGDAYQITSVYFDTEQLDVFHRRGSYGRSKYRVRQYGESDLVFLERKLKTNGLLTKRRTTAPMAELETLTADNVPTGWSGKWFHKRLSVRRLKPVCQITYQRNARVTMTANGPIRLTLDENARAIPASDIAFADASQGTLLLEDKVILELKYRRDLPALFKQLIEQFALNPQPFSKYRHAAAMLGIAPMAMLAPAPSDSVAAPALCQIS